MLISFIVILGVFGVWNAFLCRTLAYRYRLQRNESAATGDEDLHKPTSRDALWVGGAGLLVVAVAVFQLVLSAG